MIGVIYQLSEVNPASSRNDLDRHNFKPVDSIQKTYAYGNFQWQHLGVGIPFSEIGAASHGEESESREIQSEQQ